MRAKRWLTVAGLLATAACADILGIDDGIPRTYDASVDGGLDAADAGDAADAVVDKFSPLHCGNATCNFAAGQSCCWSDAGFGCSATPQCDGVYIPCDRPEQCAQAPDAEPNVCCADDTSVEGGAIATAVACLPASQCTSTFNRFPLCGDDSGVECQGDASCGESVFTLPTFLICK
jgi:hypothetical protein